MTGIETPVKHTGMEYSKAMYSGRGQLVAFKLKPEQIELLDELHEILPEGITRSDLLRHMVLPYLEAMRLAKDGKEWQAALQFGKGLVMLKNFLKQKEEEERQQKLDLEERTTTVAVVPELVHA